MSDPLFEFAVRGWLVIGLTLMLFYTYYRLCAWLIGKAFDYELARRKK